MKLKKGIQYYDTGEIHFICLKDENNKAQKVITEIKKYLSSYVGSDYDVSHGEYINYHKDGSIYSKGFCKDGWLIGKACYKGEYHFYSFINLGYKQISEQEHKKELAMVRLGLIEVPELSYLLKDYDETGKII